jgi:hypothetical protein
MQINPTSQSKIECPSLHCAFHARFSFFYTKTHKMSCSSHTLCYKEWVRQGRLDINNKEEGAPFTQPQGQLSQAPATTILPDHPTPHLFCPPPLPRFSSPTIATTWHRHHPCCRLNRRAALSLSYGLETAWHVLAKQIYPHHAASSSGTLHNNSGVSESVVAHKCRGPHAWASP